MIKTIQVVSFNENERQAVERTLDEFLVPGSPWGRKGPDGIRRLVGADEWRLEHVPLRAQGNIVAGAQLAEFFSDREPQDFVVFYGCAAALSKQSVGSAFLVQYANYLSLGTVELVDGAERVTLKNKWLCHLRPPGEVDPLDIVEFPLCIPGCTPIDLCNVSRIPPARVAATDKVIKIKPDAAPTPMVVGPPHNLYGRAEWSYGTALGLMDNMSGSVLVDMESYGIGRVAQALKIEDRVVILRVTTDGLEDHASSDQRQQGLLNHNWELLARVVGLLLDPIGEWQ